MRPSINNTPVIADEIEELQLHLRNSVGHFESRSKPVLENSSSTVVHRPDGKKQMHQQQTGTRSPSKAPKALTKPTPPIIIPDSYRNSPTNSPKLAKAQVIRDSLMTLKSMRDLVRSFPRKPIIKTSGKDHS